MSRNEFWGMQTPVSSETKTAEQVDQALQSLSKPVRKRPTGDGPMVAGWIAIVVGVLLIVVSLGVSRDVGLAMMFLGAGLSNLGLIGVVAGYIVRAISFLPGSDSK